MQRLKVEKANADEVQAMEYEHSAVVTICSYDLLCLYEEIITNSEFFF